MLDKVILELAAKLSRQRGFKTPFDLIIEQELPRDQKNRERIILIKAGNPPTIFLSRLFIQASVETMLKNGNGIIPNLRDTMERALEFLPKMQHTLAIVPYADAVSLRRDSKNWAKALVPGLVPILNDKWFEIEYTVRVKDKLTDTELTRTGKDLDKLIHKAKFDLTRMIMEIEEVEEVIEKERVKDIEVKPNEISITIEGEKVNTNLEY